MNIIIKLYPDNPEGLKELKIHDYEGNPELISIQLGDHFYDVSPKELYRAMLPFVEKL